MTPARHFEFLVEEPSMEAFLNIVLPRVVGPDVGFSLHVFRGKNDLLAKLDSRLKGYARWLPDDYRIVILMNKDGDDCTRLKSLVEVSAASANIRTKTAFPSDWQLLNRIVVEELEAWLFGHWGAVCKAYPRLSKNTTNQAGFRNSDCIAGGTWEALERLLKNKGYFEGGLRKVELAKAVAENFDPAACTSQSFSCFRNGLWEAMQPGNGD